MNKKGQGKAGLVILFVVAIVSMSLLVFLYVRDYRAEMKQDVIFVERMMFVNLTEAPNSTLIENCNSLYGESKPQTYFLQMYDCLKNDITLDKIEITIAYENLTRELLEEQCECIKEGRKCKIYKCGEMSIWGKFK